MIDPRPYLGITWQELGRARDGCDCWGLVRLVLAEQLGVSLPSYERYDHAARETMAAVSAAGEAQCGRRVTERAPRAGDVWLCRMPDGTPHAGVVVEGGAAPAVLHITRATGGAVVAPVARIPHRDGRYYEAAP